ncbi:membrane-anchored protein [Babesia caballi]|uniref:Membrane-anchored protein n=1 Tax=Babesia caballi TaxID=5871 RepID=A0AAV4M173_BABCB|nr:membrane-anchored protein [Babesia caballi]
MLPLCTCTEPYLPEAGHQLPPGALSARLLLPQPVLRLGHGRLSALQLAPRAVLHAHEPPSTSTHQVLLGGGPNDVGQLARLQLQVGVLLVEQLLLHDRGRLAQRVRRLPRERVAELLQLPVGPLELSAGLAAEAHELPVLVDDLLEHAAVGRSGGAEHLALLRAAGVHAQRAQTPPRLGVLAVVHQKVLDRLVGARQRLVRRHQGGLHGVRAGFRGGDLVLELLDPATAVRDAGLERLQSLVEVPHDVLVDGLQLNLPLELAVLLLLRGEGRLLLAQRLLVLSERLRLARIRQPHAPPTACSQLARSEPVSSSMRCNSELAVAIHSLVRAKDSSSFCSSSVRFRSSSKWAILSSTLSCSTARRSATALRNSDVSCTLLTSPRT